MWNLKCLDATGQRITCAQFYSYYFQIRKNKLEGNIVWNPLLRCGILFQQYVCDIYSKMEIQKLK